MKAKPAITLAALLALCLSLHGCRAARRPALRRVAATETASPPQLRTEAYDRLIENAFIPAAEDPVSTFSIDMDSASYGAIRGFVNGWTRPPKDCVRIEEMINYFTYDYPAPTRGRPLGVSVDVADCPWRSGSRLVRIGLKARGLVRGKLPRCNIVFLLDVSGSMVYAPKLPLVKKAMNILIEKLGAEDRVAVAIFARRPGLALASTPCSRKEEILGALSRLTASGATNGAAGLRMAYRVARRNFIKGGVNRVILCTEGDFNVGLTDRGGLDRLIEERSRGGVFLTVLGFSMGAYKTKTLEELAARGNGTYAYIDSEKEAARILGRGIGGTLAPVARDVKVRVRFNPAAVKAYRLIGYENLIVKHADDSDANAGEIGAGVAATALYEIIPAEAAPAGEMMTVTLRYTPPGAHGSRTETVSVEDPGAKLGPAPSDFKFAAAVAMYGMILRDSTHKGDATLDKVLELARQGKGADPHGARAEFIGIVEKTKPLMKKPAQIRLLD